MRHDIFWFMNAIVAVAANFKDLIKTPAVNLPNDAASLSARFK